MESLFNEATDLQVCNFIEKRLQHMFSSEISQIFQNTYSEKHLQTTTSTTDRQFKPLMTNVLSHRNQWNYL